MRSPTRTLLLVAVVALGGLVILGWLGRQYRSMLPQVRPAPAPVAARAGTDERAHAFLEVRRALKARLDREPEAAAELLATRARGNDPAGTPAGRLLERLRGTRDEVLRRTGLDAGDYRALVQAHRAWRERGSTPDPATDAAFGALRGELAAADLGRYEGLDE